MVSSNIIKEKGATSSLSGNFINPEEVADRLDFRPGMKIADFGCGTGYFVFPLAKKVEASGVVYALDVLKEKLESVESQAKLLGFHNVVTKRANLEKMKGSGLPDQSVDWVILVNMLFQNKDKKVILEEAKRVLVSGGKMLVVEWVPEGGTFGPKESLKISKEELARLSESVGLIVAEDLEINDLHYGLVFKK